MPENTVSCPNCSAALLIEAGDSAMVCSDCGTDLRILPDGSTEPFFNYGGEKEQIESRARKEIAAGRKANAFKLLKDEYDLSLKDAYEYVEALEYEMTGKQPLFKENNPDLAEVRRLALQGRKIDAIKAYQALTNSGLKEAKAAVESLLAGETPVPGINTLRSKHDARQSLTQPRQTASTRPGCFIKGLLFVILPFFLIFAGCGQYVRTTGLHMCVEAEITSNETLREKLGSPLRSSPIILLLGYESRADFSGSTTRSAEYIMRISGNRDRAWMIVNAQENPQGYYTLNAARLPANQNFQITESGQIKTCKETR